MNNRGNLLLVIIASAVVVISFMLPWKTTYGGGLAFTSSGYAIASRGLSDQYAYLHWLYYLPITMALLCGGLSLMMFIKRHLHLPILIVQFILTIFGLLPFVLFFVEIRWMNQWRISYTEPRLGLWVSAIGLIGVLFGLWKNLASVLKENGGQK